MPVAAYNVGGEYAMIKAAAAAGHLDERDRRARDAHVDPPRRRRHRHHLSREGRRPVASVTPKIRSRKDGAAVPLDEFDKQLLNPMQGSFPIVPRPYAEVADALGVDGGRGPRARRAS